MTARLRQIPFTPERVYRAARIRSAVMDAQGKVALVTGGAHRLGKAISLALARAGARVVVNYHASAEAARQTAAEIEALGTESLLVQADVASEPEVKAMIKTALARFGRLDILVNNASVFRATPFTELTPAAWSEVLNVNLTGPFLCAREVGPIMLSHDAGKIINISDLSAFRPWRNFLPHSVAKAGLLALTRGLALELAPTVQVNAIAPGPILPPPHFDEAQIRAKAEQTLLKRWGSPDDIAQTVLFLIHNDYITGQVIVVDGGELMR